MEPGAIFAATFMQGKDNYQGDEWVYPGCVTYTLEHMSELAAENGLECTRLDWKHPNGQTWVAYTHREK